MNDFYTVTIFPIELIYKYLYLMIVSFIGNYGFALLCLSLLNYFLLIPLNKLVRGLQEKENSIQEILEPLLKNIRATSRDEARHRRIQKLYERYSYHPIFAIRSVFPLFVQLPFLMAVYFMLSSLSALEGVSFLFLQNLAQPDGVLLGLNLMPFVMTCVSLVNACFVVKLSKPQRKQAVIVALLFFALLYTAPSALLLYWTMNNVLIIVFSLLSKFSIIKRASLGTHAIKSRLLPSMLDSSGLFLGLSFTIPLYFTLGMNVNFVSEAQLAQFFTYIPLIFLGFMLLGIVIDKIILASSGYSISISQPYKISLEKNANQANGCYQIRIKPLLYIPIAILATICITLLCINIRLYLNDFLSIQSLRLALVGLLFFIIKKLGFKLINVAMLSLLIFCAIQFALGYRVNVESIHPAKQLVEKAYNLFPIHTKLKNKPNLYLVYIESYMSAATLRETYHIDNSTFENTLTDKGFQVYDDFHAHTPFTKGSLLNILLMQDDVSPLLIGESDVTMSGHDIISGGEGNLLFDYLKMNGYTISNYYDKQEYYIKNKGKLIDNTIEGVDQSFMSILKMIAPFLHLNINKTGKVIFNIPIMESNHDIYPRAFEHIDDLCHSETPFFIMLKPFNELHLDGSLGDILSSYKRWISSGVYQRGVEKMNKELLLLINKIEESDPNALIILLGDHGHKYASAASNYPIQRADLGTVMRKSKHLNMTPKQYIDDMYSVFLAIKMPRNAAKIPDNDRLIYADLFRCIFANLDNNPIFLENKSSNICVNMDGIVLKKDDVYYKHGVEKGDTYSKPNEKAE